MAQPFHGRFWQRAHCYMNKICISLARYLYKAFPQISDELISLRHSPPSFQSMKRTLHKENKFVEPARSPPLPLSSTQIQSRSDIYHCGTRTTPDQLSLSKLNVRLATRLNVGVVPPDAHNKCDHHGQKVVNVNRPFVGK
jgi:hypothetical protein